MPEYRRIYHNGGIYFFTLVTYQRRPIFSVPISRNILLDSLERTQKFHPFTNLAYCLLPDHLHFLWQMPENDSAYSMRISLLKSYFTKKYKQIFPGESLRSESRTKRRESNVWQRRFWEHVIRDQEDFNQHMDYIHYNPVKHGLVTSPSEWESSSFLHFVNEGIYASDWGKTIKMKDQKIKFGE